jgi:hypothetical protein
VRRIPIIPRVAKEDMVEGLGLASEVMPAEEDGSRMDDLYAIACVPQPILLDRFRSAGMAIET